MRNSQPRGPAFDALQTWRCIAPFIDAVTAFLFGDDVVLYVAALHPPGSTAMGRAGSGRPVPGRLLSPALLLLLLRLVRVLRRCRQAPGAGLSRLLLAGGRPAEQTHLMSFGNWVSRDQ